MFILEFVIATDGSHLIVSPTQPRRVVHGQFVPLRKADHHHHGDPTIMMQWSPIPLRGSCSIYARGFVTAHELNLTLGWDAHEDAAPQSCERDGCFPTIHGSFGMKLRKRGEWCGRGWTDADGWMDGDWGGWQSCGFHDVSIGWIE